MSAARKRAPTRDPNLPALLPPRVAPIPPGFKLRDLDDPTPRGDQSITLDEEDERILDKVWAEIARHPRMAADPDTVSLDGQARHVDGRPKRDGRRRMPASNREAPAGKT